MRIRWDPKGQRFPAFHGRYVLYAHKGQLRIQSWPRKRGPSKSPQVRIQNQWFKDANKLAKHCAASQQAQAIAMTKGTGLYPRDLLLKCMVGGIIAPITADGRELLHKRKVVNPVTWQGFALNLAANHNIGIGVLAAPPWPLPTRDDLGFWSVASPGKITIPPGVTWMNLMAAGQCVGTYGGNMLVTIRNAAGREFGRSEAGGNTNHGSYVSSGPIPVIAGETYAAKWFFTANGNLQGTQNSTWFAGIVLEGG